MDDRVDETDEEVLNAHRENLIKMMNSYFDGLIKDLNKLQKMLDFNKEYKK